MVAISMIGVALAAVSSAFAAPSTANHGPLTIFSELKQLPSKWQSHGAAAKDTMVKMQIGLKQGNIRGLQERLLDVANLDSPNLRKWLSQAEIAKFTEPAAGNAEAVKSWLASKGITEVSQSTNDWIEFSAPVHQIEGLLDTTYEMFSHTDSHVRVPRTTKYSVPEALHSVIDVVTPNTAFYSAMGAHLQETEPANLPQLERRAVEGGCLGGGIITPSCIKAVYNVDYTSKGSQLVATAGMLGIGANHSDYAIFGHNYVPGLEDFQDIGIGGGYNNGNGTKREGNLDTHIYLSAGPTARGALHFDDALANIASFLNSEQNPPSVISISYGAEEADFDPDYLDRVCNEFMKTGARSITVIFSSGDQGVGGNGYSSCPNGFIAKFPASCPWITSVGGTQFVGQNEEVVADFHSINQRIQSPGGGYSNNFAAPDYNANITTTYADSLQGYVGLFNRSGRGYPGLSLVSVQYSFYIKGGLASGLGTSSASLTVGALIGILNDYLHSQGKGTTGFINPLIYSSKAQGAFNDITSGNNKGCGTNGFYASPGWDPASGLGSLNFGKLRAIL